MTDDCQIREFCNLFAQRAGEDPAGTANVFPVLLAVTLPGAWSGEGTPAALAQLLKPVSAQASEAGLKFRMQALHPEPEDGGLSRVVLYRRPQGTTLPYGKTEFLVPPEEVAGVASALLLQSSLDPWQAYRVEQETQDWLVCTHGALDSACGKFGVPVYQHLKSLQLPGVRVFRTSHFGGHRFAPTLISLPEGRMWAHLSPLEAEGAVRQTLSPQQLRLKLRGWMATNHFGQILEREAWLRFGWEWVGFERTAKTLQMVGGDEMGRKDPRGGDHPPTEATVQIEYRTPAGATGKVLGTLVLSHQVETLTATGTTDQLASMNQYRVQEVQLL